jgi:catechol 2,3-dioxygenase
VHLKVADLPTSEAFYRGVLGLDVMQSSYPGALFVAAGGYHHHIGLNTWQSAGGDPPPSGTVGLRSFELRLPDAASLQTVLDRIEAAGIAGRALEDGVLTRDPSGNGLVLTA